MSNSTPETLSDGAKRNLTVREWTRTVIVGDPTSTEIADDGPAPPDVNMSLSYDQAWCAVAISAIGALLVWADTGKPYMLICPVALLLFFSENKED
jgi:hypothetical protein